MCGANLRRFRPRLLLLPARRTKGDFEAPSHDVRNEFKCRFSPLVGTSRIFGGFGLNTF